MNDAVELKSLTYPRRSSDFCILASEERDGRTYAISGTIDTIGRPRKQHIRKVIGILKKNAAAIVRDEKVTDLQKLDKAFKLALCEANDLAKGLESERHGFLGFCFVFALRVDDLVHVFWMGDCRAYIFVRETGGAERAPCEVRCLTRDNNSLDSRMRAIHDNEENQQMQMLKSEILELSRQLKFYLGMGHANEFAAQLNVQTQAVRLDPGCALMLTTDGLIMPIIRYEVANAGFNLTIERLYLEQWFERYLSNGEYFRDLRGMKIWDAMVTDIKESCLKYTSRKRRYRDDMAVIYMYRNDE